jgi:hypothetical protein
MKIHLLAIICLLPLANANVHATQLFVSDMLRVNVWERSAGQGELVGIIASGMRVELIEQEEGYGLIRSGELEGWVKLDFLSSEPPGSWLRQQFAVSEEEQERIIEELKMRLDLTAIERDQALERAEVLEQELRRASAAPAAGEPQLTSEPQGPRFKLSAETLPYWIGGILFIALLGFLSGISWYKNHVSRRIGGLRL